MLPRILCYAAHLPACVHIGSLTAHQTCLIALKLLPLRQFLFGRMHRKPVTWDWLCVAMSEAYKDDKTAGGQDACTAAMGRKRSRTCRGLGAGSARVCCASCACRAPRRAQPGAPASALAPAALAGVPVPLAAGCRGACGASSWQLPAGAGGSLSRSQKTYVQQPAGSSTGASSGALLQGPGQGAAPVKYARHARHYSSTYREACMAAPLFGGTLGVSLHRMQKVFFFAQSSLSALNIHFFGALLRHPSSQLYFWATLQST